MAESESELPHDLALAEPAERRLERVLERLPQAVVVIGSDLTIEYTNSAAERLFDIGSPSGEQLPEPWPDFSLRGLAESLFGSSPAAGTLVHTGDRIFWITGIPPSETEPAILVVDDVTERERSRRSERHFVQNAAHELRTPLAAITSVIDVLESGAKDVPEVRDRFLGHIRVHSERLSRLATSLLVLARIQTGQQQPRLELVPVEPLLEEVAARLLQPDGVGVNVVVPDHVAALADRDLLYHALDNVAANASKHTPKGEIVLEARALGRTVEIEVRDTGIGMEREDAQHAFDRFYRGRSPEGFGLGLAIADEAIHALGGTITLDSELGVGTRVRIRIPSARLVS
jgi:signal transduction histidine kinase